MSEGGANTFRLRGREISRIEALSDAVFGFAITLLVVSLEVPRSYDELVLLMRGFVTFGVCFAQLVMVWHLHATFFRRYGLHDQTTVVLNLILLFVVVFYIYPLKFMYTLLIDYVIGLNPNPAHPLTITAEQAPTLMTFFSTANLAVFFVLGLMFVHAYRKRKALGLTPFEIAETRGSIGACVAWVVVAGVSILLACSGLPRAIALAGFAYFLLGPLQGLNGWLTGRRIRALS